MQPRGRSLALGLILSVLVPLAAAQPNVNAVLNGASFEPFVCAGALVSIFGRDLADSEVQASTVPLPTVLDGVSVTVNGIEAPLYFVSPTQINAQIPFEVSSSRAPLVVRTPEGDSVAVSLDLLPTAPAIFTVSADGAGTPVLLTPGFDLLDTVPAGQRVILYATGLGQTNPPAVTGVGGISAEPFQRVIELPDVFTGNQPAVVEFAGMAPGFPGVYQLNLLAPDDFASNLIFLISDGRQSNRTMFSVDLPSPTVGSDVITSQGRFVEAFRRIQLLTEGTVEVQVGGNLSVSVEGDDNILPLFVTDVYHDTLRIYARQPFQLDEGSILTRVTVPNLEGVDLAGVGAISVDGLTGNNFSVSMVGVGAIEASGAVDSVDAFMKAVGTIALFDLSAQDVRIWVSGVGTAQVNAQQSLFARVFGLGTVVYSGNPATVDADVRGLGQIRPQ